MICNYKIYLSIDMYLLYLVVCFDMLALRSFSSVPSCVVVPNSLSMNCMIQTCPAAAVGTSGALADQHSIQQERVLSGAPSNTTIPSKST